MSLIKLKFDENYELRSRIEKVLYDNGITIGKFALLCEVSYETLRSILKKDKLISYVVRGKIEKVLSEFEFDTKLGG